jgi:hypothetical protein
MVNETDKCDKKIPDRALEERRARGCMRKAWGKPSGKKPDGRVRSGREASAGGDGRQRATCSAFSTGL